MPNEPEPQFGSLGLGWLATAQQYNRAAAHGLDQALLGVPSAAVHGARALVSGDWSGEAQRRLDAKEAGLSDLKEVSPWVHKGLMELTSMPVPSNPHSAVNAIAGGAGKLLPAIFAGIGAKTAPLADLDRAKHAEAVGIPREKIWQDHGWFKGADGKWRWEIDDSASKWHIKKPFTDGQLPEFYHHKELFNAYPELNDFKASNVGGGAYFDPSRNLININGGASSPNMAGAHESQHSVQRIEKHAIGGAPRSAPELDLAARMDWYHRLAGETEARAVESRTNLSPAQRRARPPWLDYDVPESQQIVRHD